MSSERQTADAIIATRPVAREEGDEIGRSREGRPIRAFRLGAGALRVSLVGGCHADEPVGPLFLRRLVAWLRERAAAEPDDRHVRDVAWWIIPHLNPDGEARNAAWHADDDAAYDVVRYLAGAVRERPGDDVEFGFGGPRPENAAALAWWRRAAAGGDGAHAARPFHLHVSLHGMAYAGGPWFLIDRDWVGRTAALRRRCAPAVARLGYALHDVERNSEKGFTRIERGFCTRPDSERMRAHFLARGDAATASRLHPSSMEAVRSLGGDALTLVTEMPLFIAPGVGEEIGPPDPAAEAWRERMADWQARAVADGAAGGGGEEDAGMGDDRAALRREIESSGLRAMELADQMRLQWTFIAAGIEAARTQGA